MDLARQELAKENDHFFLSRMFTPSTRNKGLMGWHRKFVFDTPQIIGDVDKLAVIILRKLCNLVARKMPLTAIGSTAEAVRIK